MNIRGFKKDKLPGLWYSRERREAIVQVHRPGRWGQNHWRNLALKLESLAGLRGRLVGHTDEAIDGEVETNEL